MNLRILLIEDESMIADIYERSLGRLVQAFPGASIIRIKSLAEEREILRNLAPDVCVMDLNLLDASASETIEEIKAICSISPVVVVTGLDDPKLRSRCVRAGASGFIHKRDMTADPGLLERLVTSAISAFKIHKREGLSRDIEALRKFALEHGTPET